MRVLAVDHGTESLEVLGESAVEVELAQGVDVVCVNYAILFCVAIAMPELLSLFSYKFLCNDEVYTVDISINMIIAWYFK